MSMDEHQVTAALSLAAGWTESGDLRRWGLRGRLAILRLAVRVLEVAVQALPGEGETDGR